MHAYASEIYALCATNNNPLGAFRYETGEYIRIVYMCVLVHKPMVSGIGRFGGRG